MRYQRSFTLSYALLILLTLFAPETYGVSLKYVFVPLALMLLFGIVGKGISLRLKFKPHFFVCLCWLLAMVYSTLHSDVVTWSPGARSFCVFLAVFALLYEIAPQKEYMNAIKRLYVCLTLFCALWIILQSFIGLNRSNFRFVFGKKDVNCLAAFMLPGIYMSIRFAFLEKWKSKGLYLLCLLCSVIGLLLLQSRASFLTFLIVVMLCFVEFVLKYKLNKKRLAIICLFVVGAIIAIGVMWSSPAFSRLTDMESYGDDVRLRIWDYAMEAYRRNPYIGSGINACNVLSEAEVGLVAHNYYIEILGGSGIVGFCLFLILSLQILNVPKGERMHMFSFYVACMLPLGFINGLQTISSWLPLLLLSHEHMIIKRSANYDRNDNPAS